MSVVNIQTQNFRNLENSKIELHPDLNFFFGFNGSGKSSILESLFYLGHGKSFRTTNITNLITHDEEQFVVSAKTSQGQQLGILKTVSGETKIKLNGVHESKLSILAKQLAVQVVTPETFKLFFGGPKERRKFFDLGLFHVEQSFSEIWQVFNKTLKQRNACLKNGIQGQQLDYWTEEFCVLSQQIAELRLTYVTALNVELSKWLEILLPDISENLTIGYSQGWNSKKALKEVLELNRQKELLKGYSLFGAQKFDIRFSYGSIAVEQKLSRGQQKLFLLALTFAQTKLIEQVKRIKPILLIDDIGAELDSNSRKLMFDASQQVNCQTLITAIDDSIVKELASTTRNNYKMFHVEHGQISAMNK